MIRSHGLLLPVLLAALGSAGCVERMLTVRTDPPGAEVRVNGIPAGASPVEVPFTWYGTFRVEADPFDTDNNGFPDFARTSEGFEIDAPWHQWFPIDFFSENLLPWTVVDRHSVTLVLDTSQDPESPGAPEHMKAAAERLRTRAEKARLEAEREERERRAEGGGE